MPPLDHRTAPLAMGAKGPADCGLVRILIGASTGALPTLEALLTPVRPPCPAIVLAQHMPPHYLVRMAERLAGLLRIPVRLVDAACALRPSTLYLAGGGGQHTICSMVDGRERLTLRPASRSDLNVPSIGMLFESAAKLPDADATLAILLSGMGRDGAVGLRNLKLAGSECWIEDPDTARVASMPRAAIAEGAAPRILRGPALGMALSQRLGRPGRGSA